MRTIIYTCMISSLLPYFDKVDAGKYSKDKDSVIYYKTESPGIGIDSNNDKRFIKRDRTLLEY